MQREDRFAAADAFLSRRAFSIQTPLKQLCRCLKRNNVVGLSLHSVIPHAAGIAARLRPRITNINELRGHPQMVENGHVAAQDTHQILVQDDIVKLAERDRTKSRHARVGNAAAGTGGCSSHSLVAFGRFSSTALWNTPPYRLGVTMMPRDPRIARLTLDRPNFGEARIQRACRNWATEALAPVGSPLGRLTHALFGSKVPLPRGSSGAGIFECPFRSHRCRVGDVCDQPELRGRASP